ncbi:MAG: hypothetical protein U0R26_03060 [Solirubrobacterales bacterium]
MSLGDELRASPLVAAARRALGEGQGAWVVGGAVRDAVLGREVADLDLAVEGDPGAAARAIASELGEHAFELSAEFGTWRVVSPSRSWQVDATGLRGGTIEEDLAERDFTIGAVALPLASGELIHDPSAASATSSGGPCEAVGERSFAEDRCGCCGRHASPPSSGSRSTAWAKTGTLRRLLARRRSGRGGN